MKRFLIAALAAVLAAFGTAYGQSDDVVSLWADAGMTSCEIVDAGPGLMQVHMFHTGSQPTRGVAFTAPTPACWGGATFLADFIIAPFVSIANNSHGTALQINYPDCILPPGYVGYMWYQVSGGAQPCCSYPVLPANNSATIEVVTCGFGERSGSGGSAIVNANSSCRCPMPLATEATTWGRVKSLYR